MSWQPDTGNSGWTTDGASGGGDAWNDVQTDGAAFTNGEFSARNTSKHADSVIGEPHDGGCRICHSDAHFARDCPEKPANSGLCYGCGEPGHNRADCPSKSAEKCRICDGNGHIAKDCPENRLLLQLKALNLGEVSANDAWDMLGKADEDKEIEDFKRALLLYARGCFRDGQECTFEILEQCFRDANMNTYLIAKQQTVPETHTIVSLDGKPGQEYVVSFQFSPNPRRKAFKEGWPSSVEENLDRLSKAGFIMDSMVPKCRNCGGMGHVRTNCSEDKAEAPKIAITCANCNEEGHRARDCQQPRKSNKKGCRNCGGEDHIAKECPEPPNPDNVECRNCGENGHFSKDCPTREPDLCRNCGQEGHRAKDCTEERVMKCRNCEQYGHAARECTQPKDMTKVQCRNCDEMGHQSRECPKPTDWSRVTCTNCNEKGHSYKRCQNPAASANDETGGGADDGDGWGAGETSGGSGGWGAEATSGGDW